MWVYCQDTGKALRNGIIYGVGYAGFGEGKNNPDMQDIVDVGPIPQGMYIIEAPINSEKTGVFSLPLTPDPANHMFGRSDFLCHGDSETAPGTASEGCIVLPYGVRLTMWNSKDRLLKVVRSLTDEDTAWPNAPGKAISA